MRLGRWHVRLARSMWPGLGWHVIDGRRYPAVVTRFDDGRVVYGRGGVISLGGLMLWWTREVQPLRHGRCACSGALGVIPILYDGDTAVGWMCRKCNRITQEGPVPVGNGARR